MNPDNQPGSFSVDYLNQIAPKPTRRFRPDLVQWMLISGGALILLIIVIMLTGLFSSSSKPLERLAVRLSTVEVVVGDSQAHIKDTQLRSVNSGLKLNLTNANRDLQPILSADGIDPNKTNKTMADKETAAEMSPRLEEARLNGIFDRTYAREMAYYLEMTLNLVRQIDSSTRSSSLKTYLSGLAANLVSAQEAFDGFKAAGS